MVFHASLRGFSCIPSWLFMRPFVVFHASLRGFSCIPSWFFMRPFVVFHASLRGFSTEGRVGTFPIRDVNGSDSKHDLEMLNPRP